MRKSIFADYFYPWAVYLLAGIICSIILLCDEQFSSSEPTKAALFVILGGSMLIAVFRMISEPTRRGEYLYEHDIQEGTVVFFKDKFSEGEDTLEEEKKPLFYVYLITLQDGTMTTLKTEQEIADMARNYFLTNEGLWKQA